MPKLFRASIYNHIVLGCAFSILFTAILFAQNTQKTPYTFFDQIVGQTNSGIFDGIEHFEKFKVTHDQHQYFQHKFFIWGSVIYKNQPYHKLALKYDVHADELLIKNAEVINAPTTLLDKKSIRQFELNGHIFQHISFRVKQDKPISGFFEVLLEDEDISVFKKHQKKLSRIVDGEVSYKFKDQFQYFIRYKETYYQLKKIGLLTSIFPAYKIQLKNSFKTHEKLKKTNQDKYLKSIINDLNEHMINEI